MMLMSLSQTQVLMFVPSYCFGFLLQGLLYARWNFTVQLLYDFLSNPFSLSSFLLYFCNFPPFILLPQLGVVYSRLGLFVL